MICPAPAKLNLFLHVIGRRADHYHLLQSVFQLIDLADNLHFSVRTDGLIHRLNDVPQVPAESDLIIRAARLLQSAAMTKGMQVAGADIGIEKNIPIGGGLGGGSSDAATTLIALNHLWQTGFTRSELMLLGLQLGADVPFFLLGENAFVEGIGEQLTAMHTPDAWFLVIHPGVSVPTPVIFGSADLTRDTKAVKITDFSTGIFGFGHNDLQAVAAKSFPEIAESLTWLSKFGNARMTGSGACVFATYSTKDQAEHVLNQVPAGWRAWKVRALNKHPLAQWLQ